MSLGSSDVAKSQWLITIGLLEVPASNEWVDEGSIHRESGQDDTIRDIGIHASQSICLSRHEGVSDVYDLAESVVNSWEGSIAKHLCELGGCCNLEEDLDLVQRLAVR